MVNFDILFGSGIDTMGCMLDAAQELNVVERKGSWYAYKGTNIAQGRLNAVDLLKNDPDLAAEIETEVRLALSNIGNSGSVGTTESDEVFDDGLNVAMMAVDDVAESYLE